MTTTAVPEVSHSAFEAAAHLVEQAGKGNLAFAAFLVLVLAMLAWTFFGKDEQWVRISAFLVIVASIIFFVFVLAIPKPTPTPSVVTTKPFTPIQTITPKQCSGETTTVFAPQDPGVIQRGPDGRLVDLGDAGGGTRFNEWTYTWKAPATITSVRCSAQRNEHVKAENKNGSEATCIGDINGGNDAITMHVAWDGPCDQQ